MTTPYVPFDGLAPGEETDQGGPVAPELPSFEVLKRLPGVQEWTFQCLATSAGIPAGGPITHTTAGVPSNYTMLQGLEGLIDLLAVGPNMLPTTGGGSSWMAAIKTNNVPVPGWGVFGQLQATDGIGNWWASVSIYIRENSLVTLCQQSASIGVVDIGGWVHGWTWPIRSRLAWELAHPRGED